MNRPELSCSGPRGPSCDGIFSPYQLLRARAAYVVPRAAYLLSVRGSWVDIFPFIVSFVIKMHVLKMHVLRVVSCQNSLCTFAFLKKFQSIDKAATSTSTRVIPGLLLLHYPTSHRLRPKAGQPVRDGGCGDPPIGQGGVVGSTF